MHCQYFVTSLKRCLRNVAEKRTEGKAHTAAEKKLYLLFAGDPPAFLTSIPNRERTAIPCPEFLRLCESVDPDPGPHEAWVTLSCAIAPKPSRIQAHRSSPAG